MNEIIKKRRFKFEKIVRDKCIERLTKKEFIAFIKELSSSERILELKRKLIEEATEVLDAETKSDITEELTDLQDVITALCSALTISSEDLNNTRKQKYAARGGFDNNVYITHIEAESDNPNLEYFLKNKEKYPEF